MGICDIPSGWHSHAPVDNYPLARGVPFRTMRSIHGTPHCRPAEHR